MYYHHNTQRSLSAPSKHNISIIIIVAASAGGLLILLILFWIGRSLSNRNRNHPPQPLPPIQPLAHHREQQLAKFVDLGMDSVTASSSRPTTWYDSGHLTAPNHKFPSPSGSDTSLLRSKVGPRYPSDYSTSETIAGLALEEPLGVPRPSFHHNNPSPSPSRSTSSLRSTNSRTHQDLERRSPSDTEPRSASETGTSTPLDSPDTPPPTDSSVSHNSINSTPGVLMPRPRPRPRQRPVSMASQASVSTTIRTSRSIIRGVPHGPHSQMQIVLPSPLAPSLHPYMVDEHGATWRHLMQDTESGGRLSLVDKWASLPINSERRFSSLAESHPVHVSANPASSLPSRRPPRPLSANSISSFYAYQNTQPQYNINLNAPMPPVPPIPSVYNTSMPTALSSEPSTPLPPPTPEISPAPPLPPPRHSIPPPPQSSTPIPFPSPSPNSSQIELSPLTPLRLERSQSRSESDSRTVTQLSVGSSATSSRKTARLKKRAKSPPGCSAEGVKPSEQLKVKS